MKFRSGWTGWINRFKLRAFATSCTASETGKAIEIQRVLSQLYGTEVQLSGIYQTPTGAVGAIPPPGGSDPGSGRCG